MMVWLSQIKELAVVFTRIIFFQSLLMYYISLFSNIGIKLKKRYTYFKIELALEQVVYARWR